MNPSVVVLAGPNGAGKTTAANVILPELANIAEFVNADTTAQGLSAFAPETVALEAGRIMLTRLHELAAERANFAFETTLPRAVSRRGSQIWCAVVIGFTCSFFGFRRRISQLSALNDACNSAATIWIRILFGGEYSRGLDNFFGLYQPIASQWFMYDNTCSPGETLIAHGMVELPIGSRM